MQKGQGWTCSWIEIVESNWLLQLFHQMGPDPVPEPHRHSIRCTGCRQWNDTRTVAWSQTSRCQVTWVRMVHRTLMSLRCHVFCLHAASAHLKSTRTSTGHASTVPPHANPTVLPSSRQLHGYQLRWTYGWVDFGPKNDLQVGKRELRTDSKI